uniref:Uncharacterized protein n=1 Tax=Sphaerodactylus townsendi TaxID=933632 RepID=A0ACB8FGE5_9SAUR
MKLNMAAILAISFLGIFNEGIIRGSFGSQMMPRGSCVDLPTTEIDFRRISGFEEQETPIKVVTFIINKVKRICVPHDLPWVQTTIKRLKQKPKPGLLKRKNSSSRLRASSTSRPKARSS